MFNLIKSFEIMDPQIYFGEMEKAVKEVHLLSFKSLLDTFNDIRKLAVLGELTSENAKEIPLRFEKITIVALSLNYDTAVIFSKEKYSRCFKYFLSLSGVGLLDIQDKLIEDKEVNADFYKATKGLNNYEKYLIAELIMHRRRA